MYNYDAMTRKWRKFITESYSDQEKIFDLLNHSDEDISLQGLELAEVAMPNEYDKAVDMALQHFSTIFDETLDFEDDLPTVRKALKRNKDFEKVVNLRNIAKKGFIERDIETGLLKTDKLETFIKKYLSFRDYIVKKYDKIPQVKSAFYDNALSMSGDEDDSIKYIDLFNDKNKFKKEYVLHYLKEILKEK